MAEKKRKPVAKKAAAGGAGDKGPRGRTEHAAADNPPGKDMEVAPRRAQAPPTVAGGPKAEAQSPAAESQPGTDNRSRSPKMAVINAAGETIREIQLSPLVFAAKAGAHLVYEAVKHYRAAGRRGTHMTKNRALVSGSGKKPWRQKGTGRARAGETRNPLWRHGGTVFGPQPRDYSFAMPRKVRAAALRAALSQRVTEGALKVVEGFEVEQPKTKLLKGLLARLGVVGKAVVVDHQPADYLVLSSRNLPGVKVVAESHLTAYDVLDCQQLVMSQEAIDKLEERLTPTLRG
jgi:large subunit ribosomal protein L4